MRGHREPLWIITLILLFLTLLQKPSAAPQGYKYFFYVKGVQTLTVIGVNSTSFRVYNLSIGGIEKKLVLEDSIERMELKSYEGFSEGYYYIESDRRIVVFIGEKPREEVVEGSFVPATTGGLVGKEFIFVTFTNIDVVAIEDSKIEVYDSKGKKILSFNLWQNETKTLPLMSSEVYRLVSTGRVVVLIHHGYGTGYQLVDVRGLPFGNWFVFQGRASAFDRTFMFVIPYEPCKVTIVQRTEELTHEFTASDVEAMRFWIAFTRGYSAKIEIVSTGRISVLVSNGNYYPNATFPESVSGSQIALPPNMEFRFLSPGGGAIFAPYDTNIELDGGRLFLAACSYVPLSEGTHSVKADKPIIVQILGTYWDGFYVLSDKDAVYYGPPKPSQKGRSSGGLNTIVIVAIVAVIAILVIVFMILKRRK